MRLVDLLERLAEGDPIAHSQEGLNDACFWCGAWPQSTSRPITAALVEREWVRHDPGCAWVDAMRVLGREFPLSIDGTLNVTR